jgi:hypothetical protein
MEGYLIDAEQKWPLLRGQRVDRNRIIERNLHQLNQKHHSTPHRRFQRTPSRLSSKTIPLSAS